MPRPLVTTTGFDRANAPVLASLLARTHRALELAWPGYETHFARADVAELAVSTAPTVAAVTGLVNDEPVGFLAATIVYGGRYESGEWPSAPSLGGAREARVRLGHHAVSPDHQRGTYREMYGAIAGQLIANGCFSHEVVLVADPPIVQTWFELGFGVDQVQGLRTTAPVSRPPSDVRVRLAVGHDIPTLADLSVELFLFHAASPMLSPSFVERSAAEAALAAAVESERSAIWVAERGGEVVGFMELAPEGRATRTIRIGTAVVSQTARSRGVGSTLLDAALGWSRERGFGHCLVGWTSSNPLSDAFWRANGFTPAYYSLRRRIDERIAWANTASLRTEL